MPAIPTPADRAEFRRPRSRHTGLIPASDAKREAMALAEMVDIALHRLGGIDYLVEQGRENPSLFFALLGKRMPRAISAEVNINSKSLADVIGDLCALEH